MTKKKAEALTPEVIGKPLTEQQKRFCEEYIIDYNATQAAIKAGYSKKTARSQASDLLTRLNISQYILELQAARASRVQITADDVLREIKSLLTSNIKKVASWDSEGNLSVIPSDEMPDDIAASIETIKMTRTTISKRYDDKEEAEIVHEQSSLHVKLHKKNPAILLAMKHLGMLDSGEGEEDQILNEALSRIKQGRD